LDVFSHVVRKAQDIAATINSQTAKEQIANNDLTIDQVAAQPSSNSGNASSSLASSAAALAANKLNLDDQAEPDKRVYGLACSKAKAPVGLPIDLQFNVQGFAGGEAAEIQVIETTATGQKNVIDTLQTTLSSGAGPQSIQWDTKAAAQTKAKETNGILKVNEYSFVCNVAGISSSQIPSPLCLTTNVKIQLDQKGNSQNNTDKVQIKAGDGKTYVGQVQNNEATIRNVPVGTTEPAKASAKQTGYILMASPAPAPSPGTSITPINTLPKVIHGGGWEPANQPNYNGPKQNKAGVGKMLWSLGRAATIIGGVLLIDETRQPITKWEDGENGNQYRHLLDSGELIVQGEDEKQIATYEVHNNKFGALPESEKSRVVATIDEFGNVTPVTSGMLSATEQQQLDYRVYQANGGQDSLSVWKGTGMPLEPGGEGSTKTRLPKSNGTWDGKPGESNWYSDLDEVNEVTDGKPVPFKNGRPDFSEWSKGEVTFKKGELTGTKKDFNKVYENIANEKGLENKTAAKQLLKEKGLTPHHLDNETIQLIPTKLHGNIPHIGSASDMRNGL